MNGPILSIITVNFNNNLGLLKTLESVSSQSFSSYEHIIIDAGSTDGSRETIIQYEKENPHLSFWSSESDKGIYDGMNKGIDHAKGQYLYFLNSGDCLSQDILAKIPFDGTEYLYGDTILFYKRKIKKKEKVKTFLEKLKKEYTQTHWISYIYQIIHYTINHVLYIIPYLKIKDMTLITKSYLIGHIVSSAL